MTIDQLQQSVGEWAEKTFPLSTPESIASHLREESEELASAVHTDSHGIGHYEEEAADCFLLLLHLAHKMGFNLYTAGVMKLSRNRQRAWDPNDSGRGHWKHIEGIGG